MDTTTTTLMTQLTTTMKATPDILDWFLQIAGRILIWHLMFGAISLGVMRACGERTYKEKEGTTKTGKDGQVIDLNLELASDAGMSDYEQAQLENCCRPTKWFEMINMVVCFATITIGQLLLVADMIAGEKVPLKKHFFQELFMVIGLLLWLGCPDLVRLSYGEKAEEGWKSAYQVIRCQNGKHSLLFALVVQWWYRAVGPYNAAESVIEGFLESTSLAMAFLELFFEVCRAANKEYGCCVGCCCC